LTIKLLCAYQGNSRCFRTGIDLTSERDCQPIEHQDDGGPNEALSILPAEPRAADRR